MTTEYGPCNDWPVTWTCQIPTDQLATTGTAVAAATEILWALSGRQFGTCDVTIRPCRRSCANAPWGWHEIFPGSSWLQPVLYAGQWIHIGDRCTIQACADIVSAGANTSANSTMGHQRGL